MYYTLGKAAVCYQRFGASTHRLSEQVHTRMHAHMHVYTHMHAHTHTRTHVHVCTQRHTQYTRIITIIMRASGRVPSHSLAGKVLKQSDCCSALNPCLAHFVLSLHFFVVKGDTKLRHKVDRKCRKCGNISICRLFKVVLCQYLWNRSPQHNTHFWHTCQPLSLGHRLCQNGSI